MLMKNTKISVVCFLIFGLFFSLNLGSQSRLEDDDGDDTAPDVHYEAGMGCIDCHGSADLHNMHWDLTSNENNMPHPNSLYFFTHYVENNTNESASMNCVDLEGVKRYIAKHQ